MTLLPDNSDLSNSLTSFTTASTPPIIQPSGTKLAALADTTAETFGDAVSGATVSDPNLDNVFDGELIKNGGFDTDTNNWLTSDGALLSVDSGRLKVENGSASAADAYQEIPTINGRVYQIKATLQNGTAPSRLFVESSFNVPSLSFISGYPTATEVTGYFVASTTATTIRVTPASTSVGATCFADNISVRLADPDRSVNGKGLGVHGSITKTAVATGADVVGYSGFSASNYLEQPYNGDLNFGAGDFSVMGWVKTTDTFAALLTRDDTSNRFFIQIRPNDELLLQFGGIGNTFSSAALSSGSWTKFAVVRASGTAITYVNGTEVSRETSKFVNVSANANGNMAIGYDPYVGQAALTGSLALLRISATAPTADQIAKIYDDEKVLFQPNAKATLTGSSDAVTALAHDPDTGLLHVGTPGGRSVFQGLRRVEEHTGTNSQSLAAISAVDGLVVEGK